jgi:hypothetical protein
MDPTPKRRASALERFSFYACSGLGAVMIIRNLIRMRQYCCRYELALGSLSRYRNNIDWIENLRSKGMRETVFLEMVFVSIPRNYFRNIGDRTKYITDRAKFYEQLQCDSDLRGSVRFKGKDYPITIKMNAASVGC